MTKKSAKSSKNSPDSKLKQKIKKHHRFQRDKTTHRMLFIFHPPSMKIE